MNRVANTEQRTAFQDVTLILKLSKEKEKSDIEVTPKFEQVRTATVLTPRTMTRHLLALVCLLLPAL
jgi:hypothetical protein